MMEPPAKRARGRPSSRPARAQPRPQALQPQAKRQPQREPQPQPQPSQPQPQRRPLQQPKKSKVQYETILRPQPHSSIVEIDGHEVFETRWLLPASFVNATKEQCEDGRIESLARDARGEECDTYCGATQWQLIESMYAETERQMQLELASDIEWLHNTLDVTPDPAQLDSKQLNGGKDWPALKALLLEQRELIMAVARAELERANGDEAAVRKARARLLDEEVPRWRNGLEAALQAFVDQLERGAAAALADKHAEYVGARLRGEAHAERMRTKLFFPQYGYGRGVQLPKHGWCDAAPVEPDAARQCECCGGKQPVTAKGCSDMPPWIKAVARTVLRTPAAEGLECINQVVVNAYHKAGAKLIGHFDSPHLFKRPIVSLRLLADAELSFGRMTTPSNYSRADASGRSERPILFKLPLPRGALTRMEGFAARAARHAILPVEHGPTASIILREVHEVLLKQTPEDSAWLQRNRVGRE